MPAPKKPRLNVKQKRFCELIVEDKLSQKDAYIEAGYNPSHRQSADAAASALMRNKLIRDYLEELRQSQKRNRRLSRDDALIALFRIANKAEQQNQFTAATGAIKAASDIEGWPAPRQTELSIRPTFTPSIRTLGRPKDHAPGEIIDVQTSKTQDDGA